MYDSLPGVAKRKCLVSPRAYLQKSEQETQDCPHAAFHHTDVPENTPPRESVEVRALVFTYAANRSDYD